MVSIENVLPIRDGVEFADVYVLSADQYVITCGVGGRVVPVRVGSLLPGTEIAAADDRGRLVLTSEEAVRVGLA